MGGAAWDPQTAIPAALGRLEAVESLGPVESVVLLSARGRPFTHDDAVRFSIGRRLTLLCGHYKDVDQRVAEGLTFGGLGLRRRRAKQHPCGGTEEQPEECVSHRDVP